LKLICQFSLRFKDNNIIDKDLISYNETLEIFDARGLNGSYRCRAVNIFGAEFSDSAILEVLGKYLAHIFMSPKVESALPPLLSRRFKLLGRRDTNYALYLNTFFRIFRKTYWV